MRENLNHLSPVGGDNHSHCLFYLDINGQLAYLNDYCCVDMGYAREELIAQAVGELGVLTDCQNIMSMFKLSMRGNTGRFDTTVQRKDGATFLAKIIITLTPYGRRLLLRCDLYRMADDV
jgi:PAS domain S-box-containing protein